jgi:leucyl/phenylalanyl-tRNA---protein transferase
MDKLYWLDPNGPVDTFPDPNLALTEPSGLLAVGGDLSPDRLLVAYRQGIFPWYSEGQPILWWSPDPRLVLFPGQLSVARSLRKQLRQKTYQVTLDQDFPGVIRACARPRRNAEDTWITPELQSAYTRLHRMGYAHSVEAWEHGKLVGGLYGLSIGRIFFGESMFSLRANASKVALTYLCYQLQRWNFPLIDCQVQSEHLQRLGAQTIPRNDFLRYLEQFSPAPPIQGQWHFDQDLEVSL